MDRIEFKQIENCGGCDYCIDVNDGFAGPPLYECRNQDFFISVMPKFPHREIHADCKLPTREHITDKIKLYLSSLDFYDDLNPDALSSSYF